ncbi:MAG: 4-alpha-glucanotransferase [Verrucomicrobia bacterium TMED56]|jgi:4-alpha-glucanotransferase|nr:MAG: 4-alpha-glucanotransferase [Verrucomicrobia bacterium TMED56]
MSNNGYSHYSSMPDWLSNRALGVLMHPTSFPCSYGIGSIGKSSYQFVDFLSGSGVQFWQTCPLGPTGYGDSPYQVFCSSAGNPYLIDWDELVECNLINESDLEGLRSLPQEFVNYGYLYERFFIAARIAHSNFQKHSDILESKFGCYEDFLKSHTWLKDYAEYQTIKSFHQNDPWWKWKADFRFCTYEESELDPVEIDFHCFLQYIFWGQWLRLKQYANENNVSILGDLPIYAAPDSSDVWANQKLFLLNENESSFQELAGVPPDYFNQDGQLWGNPLYNWESHKQQNYSWWLERLSSQLELFDVLRIDHFRAFHDFWSIPSSSMNAKDGIWKSGPGLDFWEKVNEKFPSRPFLAEDLGLINEGVRDLRNHAGLPGMAVLQFAFDGDPENLYLPHNLLPSLVLYLGTHDNDTTKGWYDSVPEEVRSNFRSYLSVSADCPSWDLLRYALRTVSPLVVVPAQDLLSLGSEARLNCPGEAEGNWQWRSTKEEMSNLFACAKYLREQSKITGRLSKAILA